MITEGTAYFVFPLIFSGSINNIQGISDTDELKNYTVAKCSPTKCILPPLDIRLRLNTSAVMT